MTRKAMLDILILLGLCGIACSVVLYAWQAVFGVVGAILLTAGIVGRMKL